MKKVRVNRGFTLVELLVAVVLMLILVGAAVSIFKETSDTILIADSTMTITQNARAMFDNISRDLSGVQVGAAATGPYLAILQIADGVRFMEFNTLTSWRLTDGTTGEGLARLAYRVRVVNTRWVIERGISFDNGTTFLENNYAILGQYVMADGNTPRLRVEYYWDLTTANPQSGDESYLEPTAANPPLAAPSNGSNKAFDESNMPSAVRITVDLTDRNRRVIRPFSQVFWVATGR